MITPGAKGTILVHKGALGDFLQIWPSLLALRRFWPGSSLYWAGRDGYRLWTDPLQLVPCPGRLRMAVDRLYSADTWPQDLEGYHILWFGLRIPPTEHPFSNLFFCPGIGPEDQTPPRRVYAQTLESLGVPRAKDWLTTWRTHISCNQSTAGKRALLFPGSGHSAKCWPLRRFHSLAGWLQGQGLDPIFVCGPAEVERRLLVQNLQHFLPKDLQDLQDCLQDCRLVVGNDSGPMHLAGLMGCPGLVLFGPASSRQWGPVGLVTLQAQMPCSPCTQVGRIQCIYPACMASISEIWVRDSIDSLLNMH